MYRPSTGPLNKKRRIQNWICSIGRVKVHSKGPERPPKRARTSAGRYDDNDPFDLPFCADLPNTPPLTMSDNASVPRKRGPDNLTLANDATTLKPRLKVPIRRLKSPTKRSRPNSPTKKSRGGLEMFEKPVFVRQLEASADCLPDDLRSLYSALEKALDKEEIIPHEVRDQVRALLGDRAGRSSYYREEPTPGAEALHAALCEIHAEAKAAAEDEYHETAWNHAVHTPLLRQVFASRKPGPQFAQRLRQQPEPPQHPTEEAQQPGPDANARMVTTMSATIWNDYLPNKPSMLAMSNPDAAVDEATSVSGSPAPSTSAATDQGSEAAETGATNSNRSDGKKVDYVLVMDARHNLSLRKVFAFFVYNEALERDLLPHVNQTMYRPLQWSPIACSIETKVEFTATDPLLQLGTWVAAWHKRMRILRKYIFNNVLDLFTPTRDEDRLPSTLLIQVANNEWRLYFACDRGRCIELYGPLKIGSTVSLLEAYVLTACLRAIKKWIKTEFYKGIKMWLMCDELLDVI
ncbi:hypothetical protein F4801DRAFT_569395 [Xylaria longipes]|nr:hypothetical protein F4801DRAFT_569395 [Xylaria longipes]